MRKYNLFSKKPWCCQKSARGPFFINIYYRYCNNSKQIENL